MRNSLLAALSHDLRTPLTLLVGLSESLLRARPALPAAQHDTAAILHAEARRMTALVANLLDMARIQSGQVQLDLQWQAIEEVVGTALAICAPLLEGHAVSTAIAPELPLLRFDAVLLERVLCNLLENAAKYTPAGARIEVAAQLHGSRLRLTVADDGPGIAAGQEQRIFDKFARGEKESAKPGVGLGLAICRAIVEAHGGHIEAARSAWGGAHLPSGCHWGSRRRRRRRNHRLKRKAERCTPPPCWSKTNRKSAASCAAPWKKRVGRYSRPTPCGAA